MTVTAKSKVINAALAHIGEPGFDDIDQAPAPPKLARALLLIDDALDWVLRRRPWLSCMVYASLTRSVREGNHKYAYAYDLPNTWVKTWNVASSYPYVQGVDTVAGAQKQLIWSNDPGPLDVEFVDRKAYEAYDADLRNILAYELAARLAGPIQEDGDKAERMHRKALDLLAMADGADVGEEGNQAPAFSSTFAALRASAG